MLNGKFDSLFPVPSQRQLLRVLGTVPEHKHQVLIDGPHGIRNEPIEKNALPWLDQYLGHVK